MTTTIVTRGLAATVVLGAAGVATAGPAPIRDAEILVASGDGAGTGPITVLNNPFVTIGDRVAASGSRDNGGTSEMFVWLDGAIDTVGGDFLPDSVTGVEFTMGLSAAGGLSFSSSLNGNDSAFWRFSPGGAWFSFSETTPAPGVDGFITFASRPQMTDNGLVSWISGINPDDPKGSTVFRAIYSVTEGGEVTKVIAGGDSVDLPGGGGSIMIGQGSGIDFDYRFSPSGSRLIHVATLMTGSPTNDGSIVIDGDIMLREDDPIDDGSGENWDNFDIVQITDEGDWAFSGDTNGATSSDEFIAYNGDRIIREGDTLDGVTLASGSIVRGFTLTPGGAMVHGWDDGPSESVFFTADVTDVAGTTTLMLRVGDQLDTDDDGVADWDVTDLVPSTGNPPGISVSNNAVYFNVDATPVGGGEEIELMISMARPDGGVEPEPCDADLDGTGEVDFADLLALLSAFGGSDGGDVDGDGDTDFDDLLRLLLSWGPCF